MPRISAIRPKDRRRTRLVVEFEDGSAPLEITPDLASLECLDVGRDVDDARLASIAAEDERRRCRDRAWDLLSRRQRSRAELRTELLKRRFPEAVVDATVARIADMGHLDDAAFARDMVEREAHARRNGPLLVRRKLAQRGIASDIADEAMVPVQSDETQRANARALAEKWNRRSKPEDPAKRRAAAAGFLMRRGFEPDVVWEVVREVVRADSAEE